MLLGLFWVVLMSLLSQNGAQNHQKCLQNQPFFRCCVLMAFLSSFWHLPTLKNRLFHCRGVPASKINDIIISMRACFLAGFWIISGHFWHLKAIKIHDENRVDFLCVFGGAFGHPSSRIFLPRVPQGGLRFCKNDQNWITFLT